MEQLNIFIGWDKREQEAYATCVNSIVRNTKKYQVNIKPLILDDIVSQGIFYRHKHFNNEIVSTGFAFTRFLVPYFMNYKGWALFVDCDFVFTTGLENLFKLVEDRHSVYCVKHNYVPKTQVKMDGCQQTVWYRKNWSSFMLFNCGHSDCKKLNTNTVSCLDSAYLHQMQWTQDDNIGELDKKWNWLVGEYDKNELNGSVPYAIHYTLGGPWFPKYKYCDFSEQYWKYAPSEDI